MDQKLLARVMQVAQRAKSDGYEDVAAWMHRMTAQDIRTSRPKRKRTVKARSLRNNREILVDAELVQRAMRNEEAQH